MSYHREIKETRFSVFHDREDKYTEWAKSHNTEKKLNISTMAGTNGLNILLLTEEQSSFISYETSLERTV